MKKDLPHILVIDDDERLRTLLSRYLGEHEFVVATAKDAPDARAKLAYCQFDMLVVDVMMPGEDGVSLTRSLRAEGSVPILLLTAKGETADRIAGLEAGADDYLTKPFEPKELLLRIHSILRRTPRTSDATLRFGRWTYHPEREELFDGEIRLPLTAAETKLLKALADRRGQIVSREALAALGDWSASERTVDVQVTRLRKKIEEDPKMPRYLLTVRGKGYVLRPE